MPRQVEYRRKDPLGKLARVEQEMERILVHLDPTSPRSGTAETPSRVARMWIGELCVGYTQDPDNVFKVFDSDGYKGMVIVKDIPVVSVCEHHLVPFTGKVHIGYFPNGHIAGLSKFKRLIDVYARRLQVQERLTDQIVSKTQERLEARGVMAVMECEHMCMTIRGVQAPGTTTVTSAVTGLFNDNREGEKEEFLRLIGR